MEEKLYYTPEPEEFHKGFKYEVFQKGVVPEPNTFYLLPPETEDKWYKMTFPDPFLGWNLDKLLGTYTTRVKYLDEEDILSLGFRVVFDGETSVYESINKKRGLSSGDDRTLCIYHRNSHNRQNELVIHTTIWWRENRGYEDTVFDGKLKNINELERVLKQIGADGVIAKKQ